MTYLIPLLIFWIGIFLFRGLTKIQLSAIIAIIIWHENEAICMTKPYTEFTLLFASCILLYIAIIPNKPIIYKSIFYIFSIILSIYSGFLRGYHINFGKFGYEQFLGVLQTNTSEAIENFNVFVGPLGIIISSIYFIAIICPSFIPNQVFKNINTINNKYKYLKYILLFAISIPLYYTINQHNIQYQHKLYNMYIQNKNFKSQIKEREFTYSKESKFAKDLTLILIIGESATTSHMSAYGYYRNTTPWLASSLVSQNSILFEKAFSSHSHTSLTVPYILSKNNQYSPGNYLLSETIINNLAKKGYNTVWISNQEREGQYTNRISSLALESEKTFFLTLGEMSKTKYDKNLLPHIYSEVNKNDEGKMIIIHLMGSHSDYKKRYPPDFNPDLNKPTMHLWGLHSNEKVNEINAYDYSIAYTDSFLSDLTNNIPQNKNIALVYISDHGESTIGKFYHDSIKEMHYDMFAIPMFVWFSDSFMQQYPSIVEKVRSISQRYFTNDRIYDLLTFIESGEGDVMAMTTDSADKTPIRHGQNTLMDLNWFKAAKQIHRLRELTGKNILLHRCNTLEKTQIARRCGFDGIETDVTYDPARKILVIGHDEITSDDSSLEDVLSVTSDWAFKKIWIDIKNLSPENASGILSYLENMHLRYGLKERAIIETSYGGDFIESYKTNGWFTSYYLPTIGSMEKDISGICKKGEHIRQDFSPSGLSFDIETFNEAKKICPGVFEDIPLNTWVMRPKDVDKENTITPYLLRQDLVSKSALDSILIRMDTEADDI